MLFIIIVVVVIDAVGEVVLIIFYLKHFSNFCYTLEIKYAKPKRGKTAQGIWKDIVNVNDYTQTLRMEKCL